MPSSFTSDDDLCGSRLLSLVCRGHCLIAKVLKSANEIPPVFLSGYAIDDFDAHFYRGGEGGRKGKDGSSAFFFSSAVMKSIFKTNNADVHTKKIRSQAPSYRQGTAICRSPGDVHGGTHNHQIEDGAEKKFASILVDFSYLSNPDKFDGQNNTHQNYGSGSDGNSHIPSQSGGDEVHSRKSAADQEFLEREFASKYQSTLQKYHAIFEEIYNFYYDIKTFASDLENGHFVQYTIRSLLLDSSEARQLLCEVLHLYGSLLVLLDIYVPGEIRERLIIAHYRFCEQNGRNSKASNFEELCKMFQRTDYHHQTSSKQKSDDKSLQPQIQADLLTRLPLPPLVVKSVIECLVSDDLYTDQGFAFPAYEHRSSKLSQQAAMLVVVLFFHPQMMEQNLSLMRQIVDKFFYDTWVVPLYNGTVIDLSVEWGSRFPAAKDAIKTVIDTTHIEKLNYENMKVTIACLDEVRRYLVQNLLSITFLLDRGSNILDFLRAANSALRWQILHRTSHLCPKLENNTSAMIVDEHDILSLTLLVSQLEVQLGETYRQLLNNKENIWYSRRESAVEKMKRLSRHFLGNESLKTFDKNEDLGRWFEEMANEIDALDHKGEHSIDGIQLCIEALDDVKQLDMIDSNAQATVLIEETRTNLVHMAKSASIKDNVCSIIDSIADFTYAREIMESLVPMLHSQSMRDPKSVTLLRAFFLKMGKSSGRFQQLLQRTQSHLDSVTEFHETAMLAFVKEILDVIPITIFSTLAHIADEKSLAQVPAKIEADRLIDYLHFEDRYKLAKITYELSVLTKGIFAMKKTLIGNLEIKPKSILEEGLRKELVRQFSAALHDSLQFQCNERSKQTLKDHIHSCNKIFKDLGSRIDGFQRSMIWLQDFLEIDGLNIFINETSRVLKFNVEHELMNMTHKNSPIPTIDDGVFIPLFARLEGDLSAANFMGRTLNAVIYLTEPKYTIYSNHGWYLYSGEQVCGMKTISSLRYAIGIEGLVGIDQLLSCKIKTELSRFFKFYANIQTYGTILEQFRDAVFPEWKCPKGGVTIYEIALKKVVKLMSPMTKSFCRIGQYQLLRKMMKNELRLSVDKKVFHSCLVANKGLTINLAQNDHNTSKTIDTLGRFSHSLALCGLVDPMATIFSRTNSMEGLPSLLTLFVIHSLRELTFDSDFGVLVGKEDESIDGWLLVTGVGTVLRQFHAAYTKSFFALLAQYLKCSMASYLVKARAEELPRVSTEAKNILIFLRQLSSISDLDSSILYQQVPQHLMDMIEASS